MAIENDMAASTPIASFALPVQGIAPVGENSLAPAVAPPSQTGPGRPD